MTATTTMMRPRSGTIAGSGAAVTSAAAAAAATAARFLSRCCCALPRSLCASLCARGPRSFLLQSLSALLVVVLVLVAVLPAQLRATRYSALDQTTDREHSAALLEAHHRRVAASRQSLQLLLAQRGAATGTAGGDSGLAGDRSHALVWGDEEWQHHAPPEYSLPPSIAEGVLRNWAPVPGDSDAAGPGSGIVVPALREANSGVDAASAAAAAAGAGTGPAAQSARVIAGARHGYPPHWTPHTSEREGALRNYTAGLCIVLATVPRSQPYFVQTVASLLHSLSPAVQQAAHIYVYNGATPHTSHEDVIWLERELDRARLESPGLWPHLVVVHGEERRARRSAELHAKYPAGSDRRAGVENHPFHRFDPSSVGWHHRETMDYMESLSLCAQHHALLGRGLRGEALRRGIATGEGDAISEMVSDPEAFSRAATAPPVLPPLPPRRSAVHPPPPGLSLVLEDDTVLTHDAVRRLYRGLRPLWDPRGMPAPPFLEESLPRGLRHAPWGGWYPTQPSGLRRGTSAAPWAFVRVFLTDYWAGWEGRDVARIIVPASAIFGAAAALACLALDWLRRAGNRWLTERRRRGAARAAAGEKGAEAGVELVPLRPGDRDRDVALTEDLASPALSADPDALAQKQSRSRSRSFAAVDIDIESQSASTEIGAPATALEGPAHFAPSFLELLRATPFLFAAPPAAVDTDALSADSPAPPPPPSTSWCRCGRWPAIVLVGALWAALAVALMLAVGKQNLHWWGLLNAQHFTPGLHDLPSGAAGTLGVVYPTASLPALMQFVSAALSGPDRAAMARLGIDDLVNLYSRQAGLRQFHLSPDLVQHVGAFSSSFAKNQGNFESMKTSPSFTP